LIHDDWDPVELSGILRGSAFSEESIQVESGCFPILVLGRRAAGIVSSGLWRKK